MVGPAADSLRPADDVRGFGVRGGSRSVRTVSPGLPTRLVCLLGVLAACAPTWGQITFSQDFDSGSLDVAGTFVDGSTVHLAPRATFRVYHQWTYFQASGVSGQTLTFVEPTAGQYWPYSADHRFAYSYDQVRFSHSCSR
jgi:hypothetical protein